MIRILVLIVLCENYVCGDDCTINQKWCPATKTPIACYMNLTSGVITLTNIDDSLRYLNGIIQMDTCRRLNNDTTKLQLEGYMRWSAVKSFQINLVNHNQVCYAAELHQNVMLFYHRSTNLSPVEEFKRKLFSQSDHKTLIGSIINMKYIGCANNTTDIFCLASYDDPFLKFKSYVINQNHYCHEMNYIQRSLDICYLRDATLSQIITQLQKVKLIEWNTEFEYLAQAAVVSNFTNLCYKLPSIKYHFQRITSFNMSKHVNNLLTNHIFDDLNNSVNFSIGCTVYDVSRNSFRFFCFYDTVPNSFGSMDKDSGIFIFKADNRFTVYIIYVLFLLVLINIGVISIYLVILRRFKDPRRSCVYKIED